MWLLIVIRFRSSHMAFLFYAGPSDAPLASNNFEAFVKVPKFLRPHTQIYCTRYSVHSFPKCLFISFFLLIRNEQLY